MVICINKDDFGSSLCLSCLVKGIDSDIIDGCKIKIAVFPCIIFIKEYQLILSLLVLFEQICVSATCNYLPNRESGTTPITTSLYMSKLESEGPILSVLCVVFFW